MNIEKYRAMINQDSNTMSSKDLHKFIHEATGKYEESKTFNRKVREVLFGTEKPTKAQISDGTDFVPSLDNRGYVSYFNLSEVECNMIMAAVDVSHLRLMAEVFVAVKQQLSELDMIASMATSMAKQERQLLTIKEKAEETTEQVHQLEQKMERLYDEQQIIAPSKGYASATQICKMESYFDKWDMDIMLDSCPAKYKENCAFYTPAGKYVEYEAYDIARVKAQYNKIYGE